MSCRPARTLSMFNFRFARHFEGDHTERLSGQREPFAADDIAEPNYEVYAFSLCRRPRGRYGLVPILVGRTVHHLREPKDRKGIFVRSGYSVRLAYVDDPEDPEDGEFLTGCYARVLHIRRWLLLLPLLLAALFLALTLTFCGSGSGSGSLGFLDGAKSSGGSAAPVVSIRYASYDSGVDEVIWKSQALKQSLKLSLPATCTHGGETGRNPVDSSPSVYVDLNGSGTFDDSECVWNAPDSSGYGKLLAAGSEVDTIELNQKVPAGEYTAMTVWRSVLSSDHSKPAGQSAFTWALTVE